MDKLEAGEWVTSIEAAEIAKVSERTMRQWCDAGKVKAKQVGRNWIVLKSSLKDVKKSTKGRKRQTLKED